MTSNKFNVISTTPNALREGTVTMSTLLATNFTTSATEDVELAVAKEIHWATSVVVGTVFVVIGLLGNSLSICVWSRKKMRCSTGVYLTAQAVADNGYLVLFFITDSLVLLDPAVKTSYAFGVFYSYVGYPLLSVFGLLSVCYTVGVTVDRYIMVCWFSHAKRMCNTRRALTGIGIITLSCLVVNIPHFFTYHPERGQGGPGQPAFAKTDYGKGAGSQNYEFWFHCMFLVLVPVASIFTLNLLIIVTVARMNREIHDKRGEAGNRSARKSEREMTRLLLVVTFTLLVLILFQCLVQCFAMLKPEEVDHALVTEALYISRLGLVINSAINFFLYCFSAGRFRTELLALACFRFLGVSVEQSTSSKITSKSLVSSNTTVTSKLTEININKK